MPSPHNQLFVFDIETVPDTEVVSALTECNSKDPAELSAALVQYHLDITDGKNAFPRQLFHKVVAISFLTADIFQENGQEHYVFKELRSGGEVETDEKGLLEGFFRYVGKMQPRLISFNGRTFDLPVLKYRAMKYGINARWLYHSGDKWENYNHRYSLGWHCDLLEALSDFGSSARVKMHEVCAILGLPGKFGTEGSQVQDMYYTGRLKEVREYCETDVLNTYLVYLRYMLHRGDVTREGYNSSVQDIIQYIEKEKHEKQYLESFFDAWKLTSNGVFSL